MIDLRTKRIVGAVSASALLFIVALVGSGIIPIGMPSNVGTPGHLSPEASGNFDQIVVVLMENKNLNEVYGPAPYMTGLADQYAFSQHWASITNPSQPNYIAIIGGSTFGMTGDGNHPNYPYKTIVDIIETSGHTWKAFAEDAGGTGCGLSPPRGEDHFPFLSFTTITGNTGRCANLLPGSSAAVVGALNAGTNFIWLTPNECNNMHSCPVSSGDNWLKSWVPGLLTAMAGKKAALVIMFDEAYTSPPYIYMGFSGPATKLAYKSTIDYNHYSLLKLLEDVWGGGNLGQGDVNAPSPVEFFTAGGPDFSISASPVSVSFASGLSATSTISLTNGGGFTGTVSLTAASVPAGLTTSCVPSSISGSQTSTCTLSGSTPGVYVVTVTGTSGALVHATTIAATVTAVGPTARFTFTPAFPQVNATVTFDASSSTDTDPTATLQAHWDWEGDGTWDTPFSSTLTATHGFATAGTYNTKLEIQDSHALTSTVSHTVLVFALGGGGSGAPPGYGLTDPSKLQARGPIYIGSNAGFTAANGVRSGTGTLLDPFIISDWFIDGNSYTTTQAILWIESTDAYVVVQNVRIANLLGANQWEGIQIGHWPAIVNTQHVTIRHVSVENSGHAYGIAIRAGSHNVTVEATYVSLEATVEWVHGIETDRNVQNVMISKNYINAHTSGYVHTTGIQLGDNYAGDPVAATGIVAELNTVVNATASGISSNNSAGTIIRGNLIYSDYPGMKSLSPDYPRGIMTQRGSSQTVATDNVVHMVQRGIQIGSDRGVFRSNTIYDVDYAVYVLDNGSAPGVSSWGNTIYDTTYTRFATSGVRLPSSFQGTVVDLGPGVRSTDLHSITLVTSGTPTLIDFLWTAQKLKLSVTLGGAVLFDTVDTAESLGLHAAWTGGVGGFAATALGPGGLGFQLQSGADIVFAGSGFAPNTAFNLTRSNPSGTTKLPSIQSTPTGDVGFTIPAAVPSAYTLSTGSGPNPDSIPPVTTYALAGTAGANNWYTSTVSVTLTATDDLSGVQLIHYRLDGGAWQVYTLPISVGGEGSHSVDYYATDVAGNNEASRTAVVKIDASPPTTTAQVSGNLAPDGSYLASVTVTLAATDATSGVALIQSRIDGGAWLPYANPYPLSGNGSHTIDYAAKDTAGNTETSKSTTLRISGSLGSYPATTIQVVGTLGKNGWYVSVVNVTLTATSPSGGVVSTFYSIDAAAWIKYSQRLTLSDGRHVFQFQSMDTAGYVESSRSATIGVDFTAPTLTTPSPSGVVTTSDVMVSWAGSDSASGIERYEVSTDNGAFQSFGTNTSFTFHMSEGSHRVAVKAVDYAGNEAVMYTTFTVAPGLFSIPQFFQSLPMYLPAIGLGLLVISFIAVRRRKRSDDNEESPEYEYEEEESAPPDPDEEWASPELQNLPRAQRGRSSSSSEPVVVYRKIAASPQGRSR